MKMKFQDMEPGTMFIGEDGFHCVKIKPITSKGVTYTYISLQTWEMSSPTHTERMADQEFAVLE